MWGWGVCAVSLGGWVDSRKNVCTRVGREDLGALVSFTPSNVHFGRALAARSVSLSTSFKTTFPRRLCGREGEGKETCAALAQSVSWKGGRERGGVPAAGRGGGSRAAAAPGRARVRGGDGGA